MNERVNDDAYRKSSFSGDIDCLEWAVTDDAVHLRNSREPQSQQIVLTRAEWVAFCRAVRAGEADL